MAIRTRDELKAENAADLPDNSARLISAADLRGQLDDIIDSTFLAEDLDTPDGPVGAGGSNDKADKTTTITGGELAIGGGDLSASRILTVFKASSAETAAGLVDNKAVTPFGLADTLSAIQATLDDLQAQIDALGDPGPGVPVNTALPSIGGTPTEGETLTAFNGTWTGAAPIAYARQWKRDGVAISGATGGTYVPQAGDVGELVAVTVTATNDAGFASATSPAVGPIAPIPAALILISHGQSLGRRRPPAVTVGATIADYWQPVGGNDPTDFPNFSGNEGVLQKSDNYNSFVPAQENPATGEGWCQGLGYQLRLNVNNGPMVFFAPARGATHWRDLRPGSGPWGNLVAFAQRAHEHLVSLGEESIRVRMFWTHIEAECDTVAPGGGTSEAVITAAEAAALQEEVLRVYRYTMTGIFGRDMGDLPLYITPLNSAAYEDITLSATDTHPARGGASRRAQAGQLAACQDNSSLILLPPHYQFYLFMESDGVHLGGQGRRYYAELAASVSEIVEGGASYIAPHVVSATRSGAVVTATCHFPGGGGGTRDTTTFADPGSTNWADQKYGVQFWDTGAGAFVTVSDATIVGSTMTVTLAAPPSGAGELRIAQLPFSTSPTAVNTWTARCNFRDATLSVTAEDATVLYHYMVPQSIGVA
jgi:hypothetical protein